MQLYADQIMQKAELFADWQNCAKLHKVCALILFLLPFLAAQNYFNLIHIQQNIIVIKMLHDDYLCLA